MIRSTWPSPWATSITQTPTRAWGHIIRTTPLRPVIHTPALHPAFHLQKSTSVCWSHPTILTWVPLILHLQRRFVLKYNVYVPLSPLSPSDAHRPPLTSSGHWRCWSLTFHRIVPKRFTDLQRQKVSGPFWALQKLRPPEIFLYLNQCQELNNI